MSWQPGRKRYIGFLWVAALLVAAPQPAHAYVDPGSASMFFQILIGSLLGAVVALKLYWQKLRSYFRRGSPDSKKDSGAD